MLLGSSVITGEALIDLASMNGFSLWFLILAPAKSPGQGSFCAKYF
jgi:hypothetical protein